MTIVYIGIYAIVALCAVIALLLCNILRCGKELCEYAMRIAYGLTTVTRQQDDSARAIISLSERVCHLKDLVAEYIEQQAAEENPDTPDEGQEMSEAAKAAEKAFSEGVLSILNYHGAPDKEGRA